MPTRRGRVTRARKLLLRGFTQEMEEQLPSVPVGSPREVALTALLAEFRRRAGEPVRSPPPGHEALPGLEAT